jgi:hypothetical protein
MDRTKFKPAFIAANDKVLEQEAIRQGGNTSTAPTTTTTTQAPQTTTTTTAGTTTLYTSGTSTTTTTAAAAAGGTTTNTTAGTTTTTTTAAAQAISDEVLLTRMRELTKNPDLTMDQMLAAHNRAPELTDEQKRRAEQDKKLKVQAAFVHSGKGTIDDYHRITQLANIKDPDLVKQNFFQEARELDSSLKDDEIEEMFNDHYFIETKEGMFSDAQKKIGQKRLSRDATAIRDEQSRPLADVENALKMDEEAMTDAKKWEKNAIDFAATLPRTYRVPIERIGDKEMEDFIYNLSDDEYRDVTESLKDPAYLVKQIRDEKTGKTDLSKLYSLVLAKKILQTAIKASASEHYSKGVDSVTSLLHNNPDLRNTGGSRETTDATKERQQGEALVKKDASNLMGRGPKVKSI